MSLRLDGLWHIGYDRSFSRILPTLTQTGTTSPSGSPNCPCGSGLSYSECCQPYHQGKPAPTPEALMRSRYTAYVRHEVDYLLATWHASTRPARMDSGSGPDWRLLRILTDSEHAREGQVHFRATFRDTGGWGYLEEQSRFRRENERWYYLEGTVTEGRLKPGRNDACPCGSGRKYKTCCL